MPISFAGDGARFIDSILVLSSVQPLKELLFYFRICRSPLYKRILVINNSGFARINTRNILK